MKSGCTAILHEPPPDLSEAQEREIVRRGFAALEALTGKRPIGYRSPIWQFSKNTVRLLHEAGFKYTSDFMHTLLPTWNDVDGTAGRHDQPARQLGARRRGLLPVSHHHRTAMRRAADVLEIYKEEFRAVHAAGGLFTLVMHPQLSGRPSRVLMLKEFMDYVKGFDGVWLPRPIDVVEYWRSEHRPPAMPATADAARADATLQG